MEEVAAAAGLEWMKLKELYQRLAEQKGVRLGSEQRVWRTRAADVRTLV